MTLPVPPLQHKPLRHNRNFSLFWAGEGVSLLGAATTQVLMPALALALGGGAGWLGAITTATWLPWLVIGLPAGAWVDRLDGRRVMIVADVFGAATLASIPIAALVGLLTLPQLLVVSALNGTAQVFFRAAYPGFVASIVSDAHLEPANARVFGTESAMQVVGPGVGAARLRWTSAAAGIAIEAIGYLVSAACLWRIPASRARPRAPVASRHIHHEIRQGVRYVARDRYLRWFLIIGGLTNFGLTGYGALLLMFLARDAGTGEAGAALVMGLGAAGGLLGAVVASGASARLGSARVTRWAGYASGAGSLLIPLATPGRGVVWAVTGLFLVSALTVIGNVVRSAWRQRYVPPELLGRAITAFMFVNLGTMPFAGALAGWLGTTIGVRPTVWLMAGLHLAAELLLLASPIRRLIELPTALHPRVGTPAPGVSGSPADAS